MTTLTTPNEVMQKLMDGWYIVQPPHGAPRLAPDLAARIDIAPEVVAALEAAGEATLPHRGHPRTGTPALTWA
jgi:hypothetical protein